MLGNNMFAYCQNNPVIYADSAGYFLCTTIGAIAGAASGAIWGLIEGKSGVELEASIMSGAVSGIVSGIAGDVLLVTGGTALVVTGVMAVAGALGSVAGDLVESSVTGNEISGGEMLSNAVWSAGCGAICGYLGGEVPSQMTKLSEYGFNFIADRLLEQESASFYTDILKEMLSNYMSSVISGMPEVVSYISNQM